MKNLDHYLHTSIIYIYYFFFLVLPLVWYPSLSELFEFPKMVFVYITTITLLSLWFARMIVTKKILLSRSPLDLPLLLFALSQITATIFSINRHTSIFGYYSRFHGGLLSTLSYICLFYIFIANFDRRLALSALKFILAGVIIACLYALPEHFGYSPSCLAVTGQLAVNCWVQDVQTRIFGTFGQPNWLAAYIIMLLPLLWWQLSKQKLTLITFLSNIFIQTLLFAVLLFTRSKSGLLGFSIAFTAFWTITIIKSLSFPKTKPPPSVVRHVSGFSYRIVQLSTFLSKGSNALLRAFVTTTAIFGLLALTYGTEYTPSLSHLIQKLTSQPTQSQPASTAPTGGTVLDHGGTDSGKIREIVWSGALDIFKHHPIFGTGVETFAYSYYNFRPVTHNLVSEWDFLYNKAHNEFFNIAATTGTVGLATYLLLIIYYLFLSIKSTTTSTNSLLPLALASGFMALIVSNFFGFSTVAVTVLFFIFPAIFLTTTQATTPFLTFSPTSLTKKQLRKINPSLPSISLAGYLSIFTTFIIGLFFIAKNINYLRADLYYSQAQKQEQANQLGQALQNYQLATTLSLNEPTYHNDFADALSKAVLIEASAESTQSATQLAQKAFQESATTLRLNPRHINFYKTQAGVYIRLSTLDPSLLAIARAILEKSINLAPTDAKLTYNLSLISLDQNQPEEAQQLLEHTIAIKPNYESARMQLAALYTQNLQYEQARQQYQYILNYIAPSNSKAQEALDTLP